MIFMIMALLILAVVIVWIFDVHTVLHLKARTQNAGDAAALAAARWQGISLNLIGDLNIMQALALSVGNVDNATTISEVQKRLCFVGPMVGLLASQQALKNNRVYANTNYTATLMAHADLVSSYYAARFLPPPYDGAWAEYGGMLSNIAAQGVAAGPDNTRYYTDVTYSYYHWLLDRNFYEAVAGRDWCWFFWHGLGFLQSYSGFTDWPALPTSWVSPNTCNSEVFGLGLFSFPTVLPGGINTVERMNLLRSERGISSETISNEVADITNTWYLYDGYVWTSWSALVPDNFPILPLRVKSEYDYAGADAVIRVEAMSDPRMPAAFPGIQPYLTRSSPSATRLTQAAAAAGAITWTAAAKPFGYLTVDGVNARPDTNSLVLPAFHNVRLIPVDAASGATLGAYGADNLDWRRHILPPPDQPDQPTHLDLYMQSGQAGLDADCRYCQHLQTWEDPVFRQQGIDWLRDNSNACIPVIYYVDEPGGGTRRGH